MSKELTVNEINKSIKCLKWCLEECEMEFANRGIYKPLENACKGLEELRLIKILAEKEYVQ